MNIKIKLILFVFFLAANFSCFDDGSIPGPKGTLEVMVKTSTDLWEYPALKSGSTTEYTAYTGDISGFWGYPEVGGDGDPAGEDSLYNTLITSSTDDQGDKINIVYLYSTLGTDSNTYPVLYNETSTTNNGIIQIQNIEPGTYYVIAFYDYSGGGNQSNTLNRYDRYAIYTKTDPEDTTENSTPFQDKASVITITEDQTTSITLEINKNWVLGKPKTSSGGTGRIFLQSSSDSIPEP